MTPWQDAINTALEGYENALGGNGAQAREDLADLLKEIAKACQDDCLACALLGRAISLRMMQCPRCGGATTASQLLECKQCAGCEASDDLAHQRYANPKALPREGEIR